MAGGYTHITLAQLATEEALHRRPGLLHDEARQALRAFDEYHCFVKGISWFEAKISIVRDAVRAYLAKPIYTLEPVNLYATA
jgi:hypothetical protein